MKQSVRKATPAVPEVAGFRGLRFSAARIGGDWAKVVCPPYDVISIDEQRRLMALSSVNSVHLILPKPEERLEQEEGQHSYQTQAGMLTRWRAEGVLTREEAPALYVYHQTFANPLNPRRRITRRGVIALRRLEDFSSGKVRPHERTLAGPKADRLNLMRALRANMSPIFALYADPAQRLDQKLEAELADVEPDLEFETREGKTKESTEHRLWVVKDPNLIAEATALLSGMVFIADGHHRYETALNYARELDDQQADLPADGAHHFMPMYFANLDDPGTLILPTHRLVHGLCNFRAETLLGALERRFEVHPIADEEVFGGQALTQGRLPDLLPAGEDPVFLMILGRESAVRGRRVFRLKATPALGKREPANLDVQVLHEEILEKELGIDSKAQEEQTNLNYTRDPLEAVAAIESGASQVVFLTRPPTSEQVRIFCEKGLRMPQKSTYFYPKVPTGLVFRPIDPQEQVQVVVPGKES